MKTTINLLLFISFLFISCEKKDPDTEKDDDNQQGVVDIRLKGTWQNQAGTAIYNGDEKGVYLKSTTHAAWLSAIQAELVEYGMLILKA